MSKIPHSHNICTSLPTSAKASYALQSTSAVDPGLELQHAQLDKGAARRYAEARAKWLRLGEHAALTGQAPPFLRCAHKTDDTFRYALAHPIVEAMQRMGLELRPDSGRDGDEERLIGPCPLCNGDGHPLHVHPLHPGTWGCRSCGRFGDSYHLMRWVQHLKGKAQARRPSGRPTGRDSDAHTEAETSFHHAAPYRKARDEKKFDTPEADARGDAP